MSEGAKHDDHAPKEHAAEGHGAHDHDDHAEDASDDPHAPPVGRQRNSRQVAKVTPAKGPGKGVGITMAILGTMLAFCAALVGAHRTELIKTTIEQTNEWGVYQAEAMKFRLAEGDLAMLKAVAPDKEEEDRLEKNLRTKNGPNGGVDDPDTAEVKDLIASSVRDIAELLTPDKHDEDHFQALQATYKRDMDEAKHDAEAYEGAIEAHFWASEWYERAQLLAEIGIVIASIALLLSSRRIWALSVAIAIGSAITIGGTYVRTHSKLAAAEREIEEAKQTESVQLEEQPDDDGPDKGAPAASAGKK